jgi:hypothetical protein
MMLAALAKLLPRERWMVLLVAVDAAAMASELDRPAVDLPEEGRAGAA